MSSHGVYDDGRPYEPPEPAGELVPVAVQPDQVVTGTGEVIPAGDTPTCPRCGLHDRASRINHPHGRYYCSCGHLFEGTQAEWHRLAKTRRAAIALRNGDVAPIKPEPRVIRRGT